MTSLSGTTVSAAPSRQLLSRWVNTLALLAGVAAPFALAKTMGSGNWIAGIGVAAAFAAVATGITLLILVLQGVRLIRQGQCIGHAVLGVRVVASSGSSTFAVRALVFRNSVTSFAIVTGVAIALGLFRSFESQHEANVSGALIGGAIVLADYCTLFATRRGVGDWLAGTTVVAVPS